MGLKAKVVNKALNGIDLIIGMDSLLELKAQLNCAEVTCELVVDGRRRVIKTKERPSDGHLAACSIAARKEAQVALSSQFQFFNFKHFDNQLGLRGSLSHCKLLVATTWRMVVSYVVWPPIN